MTTRSLPTGPERSEVSRLHGLIGAHVPSVGQATSYGMPCYTHRDVPFAAVVVRRRHIAWYPYSGNVLPLLRDQLTDYSWSSGTLRFTAAAPLPDDHVAQLIDLRIRAIDGRSNT